MQKIKARLYPDCSCCGERLEKKNEIKKLGTVLDVYLDEETKQQIIQDYLVKKQIPVIPQWEARGMYMAVEHIGVMRGML